MSDFEDKENIDEAKADSKANAVSGQSVDTDLANVDITSRTPFLMLRRSASQVSLQ